MTHHLFAAEGGYQGFVLTGTEKLWLVLALAAALFGIGIGLVLMRGVLKADQGSKSMRDIAKAIQEGAEAFLSRQFRAILMVVHPPRGADLLHGHQGGPARRLGRALDGAAGGFRVLCFLLGASLSGLTGFIGMSLAVRGNVRTAAAAARGGGMSAALKVAFRTGAITGMLCVGLGLLGATVIVFTFQNTATAVLDRIRIRGISDRTFHEGRGWHLHQSSRRRSRPCRKSRSGHPRRRSAEMRRRSPTMWATMSATAPAWRPTCSSRT